MTQDLALYGAQSNANGDQFNSLLAGNALHSVIDYDRAYYVWPNYYPWAPCVPTPVYPTTIYVNTGTAHRACTCPHCDGSCCDCADCKVKRLEQRVADLEKERGA